MLVVQKYGGSSLQSVDRVKVVAERVRATRLDGHDVVVVCSAMGDTSDDLIDLARQVSGAPPEREMDMLLSTGERVSCALLAMALDALGVPSRSFSGTQAGVATDAVHGGARITSVTPARLREALDLGTVPLVAGFQGVCPDTQDVTTLGRGGSDVTAVALAAGLKADVCEIYTDVDGVFTADPRVVSGAGLLDRLDYEETLELAACGAKVLMARCVEYARRHGVELHVRSSYTDRPGTFITDLPRTGSARSMKMEQSSATGVAHDPSIARITVELGGDRAQAAADVFEVLADDGIAVDMVLQNLQGPFGAKVTFTVAEDRAPRAVGVLHEHRARIGFHDLNCDTGAGKVSVVGCGLRSEPAALASFCRALDRAGIGIEFLASSELRITGICRAARLDDAVRALHHAFALDSDARAVVYAGTGR
ncbi:aspartate kinase [Streptomyces sp. NPDC049577]|uniref:aspartate kinase n=1 Tax=Streptomyces sp. NPDC049577 TaxID=3155153 RepID=UPI003436DC23